MTSSPGAFRLGSADGKVIIGERERGVMGQQPLTESLRETLSVFTEAGEPRTTPEVADRLDLGRRSAYARLERLVECDSLETKKVGASARVWWRPPTTDEEGIDEGTGDGRSEQVTHWGQQFRSLVEAVEEYAIFMLDPEGYVRTWTPGAERIKGYDRTEILGEHFSTFYAEEDRAAGVPEANLEAAAAKGWIEDEGWRVQKDSSRFWANVTITAIHDDDGTLIGYAKVTRDMTERREQEEAIRRERDLIDRVFETSPIGLGVLSRDGLERVNPRAAAIYGSPTDDIDEYTVGEPEVYDSDGKPVPPAERPNARVFETGEPVTGWECQLHGIDGQRRWLSVSAAPLTDDAGDVERVVVVTEDITEFKEQARRLERQRDEFETELDDVFERIDDAFCALDEDFRFTYVNERSEELLEVRAGDLLGECIWDLYPEAAETPVWDGLHEAMETQETTEFEVYGEELGVWLQASVYASETGLSVYFRDITERKQNERALRRSETRFRTLMEHSPFSMQIFDAEGRPIETNPAWERLWDASRDELAGYNLFQDEQIEASGLLPHIRDAFDGEVVALPIIHYDPAEIDKPGRARWIEGYVYPLLSGDEETSEVALVHHDVTDRKARERELERYETIVETVDDGIYVVDTDGYLTMVNDGYAELTGYPPERLVGMHVSELVDEETVERARTHEKELVGGEQEAARFEADVLTADGGAVRAEGAFSIIDSLDDGHERVGVVRDVSERVAREQELERQRERLAALNDLNGVAREITDAVIDQSTREEIETIVCERLAGAPPYEFAWIGEVDSQTESISPRVEAGVEGYAEEIPLSTDPDDPAGRGPGGEAIRTREMQVNQDALADPDFGPWREYAQEYGYRSSAGIPIVHEDTLYGLLGVYADRPGAFDGEEREVLAQLGEVIGHAIAAIERKRALTSDEITEIQFTAPDLFESMGLESDMPGTITFERAVPIGDGEFLEYGTVDEAGRTTLEALVESHSDIEVAEIVDRGPDTARFVLRVADPPVVSVVASVGGYMQDVTIEDGDLYTTIHLPPTVATRRIVDAVQEAFPTATLLTQRQITRSENSSVRAHRTVTEDLTDRQRAVLEAAMYSGFFEWPRESTGEDVAESLGIAPPTFSQHLRKAQQKVFHSVFQSPDLA